MALLLVRKFEKLEVCHFFSFLWEMWPLLEWWSSEENALGWQPTGYIPDPATLSSYLWLGLSLFLIR